MIDNEVIVLKYVRTQKGWPWRYKQEKLIYSILKDEDFFPKLKYFDDKHLILGLTDVGTPVSIYI